MTEAIETSPNARELLKLKLPEADVSSGQPWGDDVLERKELAARLTNLIRTQSAPFTISIHGNWGTGKTFLLKRWQRDLEHENFNAIYFNAWEDDFCNDPFLAILGQMSDYFKGSTLNSLASQAINIALPLLQKNALSILNKTTGITLELEDSQQKTPVDEYLDQRSRKDQLKQHLTDLSTTVVKETGHPLIFIIDELDRCRPTFAIELLERVKHIFDIQNMVFIFGINRDQLCVSLESEYGHIDSDEYLRRFFDIEFTLPNVDTGLYCRHVMERFGLNDYFESLSTEANSRVHSEEYRALYNSFPRIWGDLGLSLRDIDFCVGTIAMVGKNLEHRHYMYPLVLGVLIPLKLMNPELYRRFIQRKCLASGVIDYIDGILSEQRFNGSETTSLDYIEAYLYFAENVNSFGTSETPTAISQLNLLSEGLDLTAPEHLSARLKKVDQSRIQNILGVIQAEENRLWNYSVDIIGNLAKLIDLHQALIRK